MKEREIHSQDMPLVVGIGGYYFLEEVRPLVLLEGHPSYAVVVACQTLGPLEAQGVAVAAAAEPTV